MKTKMISLAALFLLGTASVFAQTKTEKIEVKGNCGMCETRIEKAANSVEGVTNAQWNKETKMLSFSMNENRADAMQVHKAVAKAGHDTKKMKATDEAYSKLPACCQYDRTEIKKATGMKGDEGHNM